MRSMTTLKSGKPGLWIGLALVLMTPLATQAATYYVAVDGNDSHSGEAGSPFATVQHALHQLTPGDTLYVRGGTYHLKRNIRVNLKGSPDAWITIEGYPGEKPVFDGSAIEGPANDNDEIYYTIFQFDDAAYIRTKNIHVQHSWGSGFRTYPEYIPEPAQAIQTGLEASTLSPHGSRHIDILECSSTHSYGPGIGIWHSEHVRVIGCEVTGANNLARIRTESSRTEAPHEAISIAAVSHFEVSRNHVHHCHKEGIDVKETSRNGVVHHNYIHNLKRQGLYADSWFGMLGNVEFHHNVVHDCEWGIAISAESGKGAPSRIVDVRIRHNLLFNNRASGVFFSVWGNDLWRKEVSIWNNTIVGNGTVTHWAGPTGGIDIRSRHVRNLKIVNNIVAGNTAFEIASVIDPATEAEILDQQSVVISNNLVLSPHDRTKDHQGLYPNPHLNLGTEFMLSEPGFIDPSAGVYLLNAHSPAIGAGSLEWDLPYLSKDLGALPSKETPCRFLSSSGRLPCKDPNCR